MKRTGFSISFLVLMTFCCVVQAKEAGEVKWDSAAIEKAKKDYHAACERLTFNIGVLALSEKSKDAGGPKTISTPTRRFNKSIIQPQKKGVFVASPPELHINKAVVSAKKISLNPRLASLKYNKSGENIPKGLAIPDRKQFVYQQKVNTIPKHIDTPQPQIK